METDSSRFTIYAAIAANLAIAATKLVAAVWTGSAAVLAEGIHSLIDTGDGLLLLVGVRLSQRPPDAAHPFGYGKDLYFWSLIVGILIFAVGGGMSIYEGVHRLIQPRAPAGWHVNLVIIGVAALFEGGSFFIARKRFREHRKRIPDAGGVFEAIHTSKDPTAFAVLLEDSAALIGLALAAAGVALAHLFGSSVFDGAASIAIGLVLATVAIVLAYESRDLLLGESAMPGVVRSIRRHAEQSLGVARVDRVLTMHLGPERVLVALQVALEPRLTSDQLAAAAAALERSIRDTHPFVKHLFIDVHGVSAPA